MMPKVLRTQLARFIVIGVLTVLIDFSTYRTLFAVIGIYSIAKAFGFICGTVFSYFANRAYTFSGIQHAKGSWLRFAALYLSTLVANVGINAAVLAILHTYDHRLIVAFLCATGTSSILNFVGMKFFVFREQPNSVVPVV